MDQERGCSICERYPDDLLVLLCNHNLCINCATQIFQLNQQANPFICQICFSQTPLDDEVIVEFHKMTALQSQLHSSKKEIKHKPPKSKAHNIPKNQNLREQNNKNQFTCQIHHEPALYYCFDCQAADICCQCILTPKHASHKVSTFKKASSMFQKKIQENIRQKQSFYEQLMSEKAKYMLSKRHMSEQIEIKKQQIEQIFNNLNRILTKQFDTISSQLQSQYYKTQQLLDGCLAQIDDKLKILQESMEMQKKVKANQDIINYLTHTIKSNISLFMPRLPKVIPSLELSIRYSENIQHQVRNVLQQISFSQSTHNNEQPDIEMSNSAYENYQSCFDEQSHIPPQEYDGPQTVLKESFNPKSNMVKMSSSRKLQMSRSFDNAANIINKLQQRSRKVQ